MKRKKNLAFFIAVLFVAVFVLLCAEPHGRSRERGTLSIYFMQEKVGYEEYTWEEEDTGYLLEVKGRMTKPVTIEINTLSIRMDRDFIAKEFLFKGKVSGVKQEVKSTLSEGRAVNRMKVNGQESQDTVQIKRDAVLLPNPYFSPYLVLTKKYGCVLDTKIELSAYIIPQMEMAATLEPKEENPCMLQLTLSATQIELEADEEGNLLALNIPSQNLRVIRSVMDHPIPPQ
jgi:hypothetical protein